MERTVLRSPPVRALLQRMVAVRLYTDGALPGVAANRRRQQEQFKTVALPLYVLLDGEGREIARLDRAPVQDPVGVFLAFLRKALPERPPP
jgi:hypothetical protein